MVLAVPTACQEDEECKARRMAEAIGHRAWSVDPALLADGKVQAETQGLKDLRLLDGLMARMRPGRDARQLVMLHGKPVADGGEIAFG